jgi:ketosteroid isomerase-like protein
MAAIKSIKAKMREINVAGDAKFACAMMQIHFDATTKNNATFAIDLRQLDAFEKIGGHWRIIQEHISVPVTQTGTPIFVNPTAATGPLAWSAPSELGPAVPWAQAKTEIYSDWLVPSEIPKTVNEMTSYYGPADDFIISDFWSPTEIRGHKAMLDFYGPQFPAIKNMDIKIPFISIQTDGAFGVQISEQELTLNMTNGTQQHVSFRQSDCLHRVGGKWYSFFEMGSFPVDMKAGKAIMVDPAAFK